METDARVQPLSPTAHLPELDTLRGVAILLVLAVHSPGERGQSGWLRPLDGLLHQFGWTGVDLFFVLSGFLIGRVLFAEIERSGRLNVKRFLLRRMFRIWPGYYAFLLYVVVRMIVGEGATPLAAADAMWPAFVNIQNFIAVPRDQLWSLAIEEQFYLVLPLVLCVLLSTPSRGASLRVLPWLAGSFGVVCLALRTTLLFTAPEVDVRALFSMDALFFGVTLAYLSVFHPRVLPALASKRRVLLVASPLLFLPALVDVRAFRLSIAVTLLFVGYGLLLVSFIHRLPEDDLLERFKATWLARVIATIGTYSYSIYLWHRDAAYPAYELARRAARWLGAPGELSWLLQLAAYVVASVLSGVVMGRLIEQPALRLRDRFFPDQRRVAAPAEVPTSRVVHEAPTTT